MPFTDVTEGNWFYKAVAYVYEQKLMSGVSETEFAPQTSLTRAMLAQVLYNMENQPEVTTTGAFTDVPDHQWYANAVNWAASENIVAGMGDGIFAPNSPVTREQMAAILYRYAQYKGYDTTKTADISDFADSNKTSAWAVPAMQWAVGTGLISGSIIHSYCFYNPIFDNDIRKLLTSTANTCTISSPCCFNVTTRNYNIT